MRLSQAALAVTSAAALALTLGACGGATAPKADAPSSTTPTASEPAPVAPSASASASESSTTPTDSTDGPPMDGATALTIPGKFWFASNQGCFAKLDIPTTGAPEGVEAARKAAKQPELTYVKVVLDCREASSGANMYALSGYTAAGKKIAFSKVQNLVEEWPGHSADLVNSMKHFVDAGEVASIWMATAEKLPAEFGSITAEAHGQGDPVYVVSQNDAQGAPLDFEDPND